MGRQEAPPATMRFGLKVGGGGPGPSRSEMSDRLDGDCTGFQANSWLPFRALRSRLRGQRRVLTLNGETGLNWYSIVKNCNPLVQIANQLAGVILYKVGING